MEDMGVYVGHSDLWGCVRDIWGDMEKSKGGVWHMGTLLIPTGSTVARRLCDTPGAGGCCGCRLGESGDGLPCPAPRCPLDCSDQGRCRAGRCHCFEGFTGPFCATPVCPPGRGGPHCTLGMSCMSPSLLLPWHLVLMPPPSILVCPSVSSAVLQCSPSVSIPVLSVVPDPSSVLGVPVYWCPHGLGTFVLWKLPLCPLSVPIPWVSHPVVSLPNGFPVSWCLHGLGTLVPWKLPLYPHTVSIPLVHCPVVSQRCPHAVAASSCRAQKCSCGATSHPGSFPAEIPSVTLHLAARNQTSFRVTWPRPAKPVDGYEVAVIPMVSWRWG